MEKREKMTSKSIITSRRLIIRPFKEDDINDLVEVLSDPETTLFIPEPNDYPGILSRLHLWIKEYQIHGYGFLAFILKDTNKLIGYGGFIDSEIEGKFYKELGYVIAKSFWRKDYACEAALALKEYGMQILHFPELIAIVSEGNPASKAVAEKIGMKVLRKLCVTGHKFDCYIYCI